jgi:hypothetical protein
MEDRELLTKIAILERNGRVVKIEPSGRANRWNLYVPRESGWELRTEVTRKTAREFFRVAEEIYLPTGRRLRGEEHA